jgi:hypothetical protein
MPALTSIWPIARACDRFSVFDQRGERLSISVWSARSLAYFAARV